MNDATLRQAAIEVLRGNDTGAFIKPAFDQYPHQWNWDAALVAIGLAAVDLPRAKQEVRTLISGQWRDGMIPHILYPSGASEYFPSPEFWGTAGLAHGPDFPTSGLTQPPVLATAIRTLYMRELEVDGASARAFLEETVPAVAAWHRWLLTSRDPTGSGLASIVHPWESGMDNSSRWAAALERIPLDRVPAFERRDLRHVGEDERPVESDYRHFMQLIAIYRDLGWDAAATVSRAPFVVQDVFFNAVLVRANHDLAYLVRELGQSAHEIDGWLERAGRAFQERLWSEDDGLFYDFDARAGAPIRENTSASLAVLYGGVADARQARRIVHEHLLNPDEYAVGAGARYGVPTTARNNPRHEPRRYWRGPVWINMNWFLARGLRDYGFGDLADAVVRDTLDLIRTAGFSEYFDGRDGTPLGAQRFSWSAALTLEALPEA